MLYAFYGWCRKDTEITFEPDEKRPVPEERRSSNACSN
jgi:hypothetical protein